MVCWYLLDQIKMIKQMRPVVGGGGTSTTPSITTTSLAVVVLLLVVLVPPPPTTGRICLSCFISSSNYNQTIYLPLGKIVVSELVATAATMCYYYSDNCHSFPKRFNNFPTAFQGFHMAASHLFGDIRGNTTASFNTILIQFQYMFIEF